MVRINIIISLLFFTTISFGQSITVSKDTLKYPNYYTLVDTIIIYNNGSRDLSIDSIKMYSYSCYYFRLIYCYGDSIKNNGYMVHISSNSSGIDFYPLIIPPNDSALLIFQYMPPIIKMSSFSGWRRDSLVMYNNSLNSPVLTTNVLFDISLNVDKSSILPSGYYLYQNCPNPFNPSTIITFGIPVRSHITLTIYNLLGSIVNHLFNKELDAGTHSIVWNSSGCSSGVYYYTLRANSFCTTKRMLLLK
jgi:hypothetical protein